MKPLINLFILLTFTACTNSTDSEKKLIKEDHETSTLNSTEQVSAIDETSIDEIKNNSFYDYLDSILLENYRIDTNRLKEIEAWEVASKSPKIIEDGMPIILLPFPIEEYRTHLNNPKTYFLAQWDEQKSTYKNGNDFLLMTWKIDSIGIEKETEIYKALTAYMGNFPCFCFRDHHKVYALGHRMTASADQTLAELTKMRNYINPSSSIYGWYDGRKIAE